MGRIKTMLVKRITNDLMRKHPESFTTSFEENKRVVTELTTVTSKKMRNIIAGYAARLKKKQIAEAV